MTSLTTSDDFAAFRAFKEMVTKQLEQDARIFLVVAKDKQKLLLAANDDDALSRGFGYLVEDDGWHPVGGFAMSMGAPGSELAGVRMEMGVQALRIERFCFQQPPPPGDIEVFAEAIAEEAKKFTKHVAAT